MTVGLDAEEVGKLDAELARLSLAPAAGRTVRLPGDRPGLPPRPAWAIPPAAGGPDPLTVASAAAAVLRQAGG